VSQLVVTFNTCFINAAKFSDYVLVALYCNRLQETVLFYSRQVLLFIVTALIAS